MKWYGTLRKSGVIELKREWKPGEAKSALARLRPGEDLFGPFESPSFPQAQLQIRLICSACGFMVNQYGKVVVPKC